MKKASTAGVQPSRAKFVKQKSIEAIERWKGSATDRQPAHRSRKNSKVQFSPGTVLLFAVSVGDIDEVKLLLSSQADVNFQNVDGLTPLHQVLSPTTVQYHTGSLFENSLHSLPHNTTFSCVNLWHSVSI